MKRSGFKPNTLAELKAAAPRSRVPAIKDKTCSARKGGCGQKFRPARPLQVACGAQCAHAMVRTAQAAAARVAAQTDKRQTRTQLEALKTVPMLKREAQVAFNAFIRARDRAAGYACICCGKPLDWNSGLGGSVDAGHYRSTGSADHLRFNEANCHAQLSQCNRFGAGRAVDYRIGLIRRIGLARVEALEADNAVHKWTRDELRAIREHYRRALKTATQERSPDTCQPSSSARQACLQP